TNDLPTRTVSIAEALRSAILSGNLSPGERLREMELSAWLHASRTPIRAALQALAGEGLVTHIPNRGYYVCEFSTDDIIQAYEIRSVLEGLAARRAAQRGFNHAQRVKMEDALERGDALLERGELTADDRPEYGEINNTIHEVIQDVSDSRMLKKMLRIS